MWVEKTRAKYVPIAFLMMFTNIRPTTNLPLKKQSTIISFWWWREFIRSHLHSEFRFIKCNSLKAVVLITYVVLSLIVQKINNILFIEVLFDGWEGSNRLHFINSLKCPPEPDWSTFYSLHACLNEKLNYLELIK
jgi:hypothetical protein